ncbi:4-phosphopantoate--beta-alanine ligase [uncultured archaeon]|nr:4-phosphopantoate--beta-alanine ligase [uncultured archaeon]
MQKGNDCKDCSKRGGVTVKIPKSHPRAKSLEERHRLQLGIEKGIVTPTGMIAHGRGEAFDYLLGERTTPEAKKQIEAAAAKLLLARKPVITVNGNTTALCASGIAELAKELGAQVEVNLFYRTEKRARLIQKEFRKFGINALGADPKKFKKAPGLGGSKRKLMDSDGTWEADAVLVMLEDGDRTETLERMGKFIIAIDLNPMSRTSRKAGITIVDNVTRAVPLLEKAANRLKKSNKKGLSVIINNFKNKDLLHKSEMWIRRGMVK